MRIMMIVKANPDSEKGILPDEKILSAMGTYNEKLGKAGALLAMDGLQPSSEGFRVKCSKGKVTVTDGPFAEAKELVAGFWLINVKSLAEGIEWAKRTPFQDGEIELRPLFETEDFPVSPDEDPEGWRKKELENRAKAAPARKPGTKRYLGLLLADRDTEAGVMPDEKVLAAMGAFFEEGLKAGVILGGEGLQPTSKAARVKFTAGKRTVVDGPFTESKELVAGYAILQYASKEEALEWTKRFVQVDAPGRMNSESVCELRPFFEIEDFPVDPAEKPGGWRDYETKFRDGVR
ncbi:MAG TPA: YciI family protein [Planctomycetota bacterium]|nr:YciI family protein [Planctomycetota bacterium]